MTEQEFDIEVPPIEQNWKIFGRMHDAVLEACKINLTVAQCKKLFLLLPDDIQEAAIKWGFNDTCFGDNVYVFVENNQTVLKDL